jgi:hypothetical protein
MTKLSVKNTSAARALSLSMLVVLVCACNPRIIETEGPHRPARSVWILTGAGMVTYSAQDPRHESTWLQVASSYAEALRTEIGSSGTQAELHIKQKRKEAAADVLTMLASHDRKDAVLQVTVYHVRSSTENTYYLMAQFMPLEYTRLSNGRRGMIPAQGVIKNTQS